MSRKMSLPKIKRESPMRFCRRRENILTLLRVHKRLPKVWSVQLFEATRPFRTACLQTEAAPERFRIQHRKLYEKCGKKQKKKMVRKTARNVSEILKDSLVASEYLTSTSLIIVYCPNLSQCFLFFSAGVATLKTHEGCSRTIAALLGRWRRVLQCCSGKKSENIHVFKSFGVLRPHAFWPPSMWTTLQNTCWEHR